MSAAAATAPAHTKRPRSIGDSPLAPISSSEANNNSGAPVGMSMTPPRGAAGAPTSRAAVTPTNALEAALRAAGGSQLEERVVFYMTGSFCPVHVQHLQAVAAAVEEVERRSCGKSRAVGAFVAPAHDDHVSQQYAMAGCSNWFLPSECRIQLAELAVEGDAIVAVDRWAAVQKAPVPAAAAQADLQTFLDGWCAESELPCVTVVRLAGSDDGDFHESQPLLCLERDGVPRCDAPVCICVWQSLFRNHSRLTCVCAATSAVVPPQDVDARGRPVHSSGTLGRPPDLRRSPCDLPLGARRRGAASGCGGPAARLVARASRSAVPGAAILRGQTRGSVPAPADEP
jgi:hypothetical protein